MLGTNPKLPPAKGDGSVLEIVEIFATIQGEGPRAGQPAVFVRLGGCNFACKFCDTQFDNFQSQAVEQIIQRVLVLSGSAKLVVVSGGEPLRQPISQLCRRLIAHGFVVQIETNGALFQDLPSDVEIVCSPKTHNHLSEQILPRITAFKFVVSKFREKFSVIPEVGQALTHAPIYVQPIDELDAQKNAANLQLAMQICMDNNYILSLQLHKILSIP